MIDSLNNIILKKLKKKNKEINYYQPIFLFF